MDDDSSWEDSKGPDYKIYDNGRSFLDFPYTVVKPGGGIITVACTRWGARRAITKHLRAGDKRPYWEGPIVERVSV
jgi:hypothetical protein